jgi:hypothetical protein
VDNRRHSAHRVVAAFVLLQLPLFAPSLLAQGLPRARAEAVGMSSQRLARLPPALRGYVERGEIAPSSP